MLFCATALALSFSQDFVWVKAESPVVVDTQGVAPLTGLAISPSGWLAGDAFGTVYLSTDQGKSWREVLAGVAPTGRREGLETEGLDEEELLDRAGEIQQEELEGNGPSAGSAVDPSAAADLASQSVVLDATERALDRAARLSRAAASAQYHAKAWWDPRNPSIALVARADGIWRSRDGGEVFQQVNDRESWTLLAASPVAGSEQTLWIAGTSMGVLYSFDGGETWDDAQDITDGGPVTVLAEGWGFLVAGGPHGLFRSPDGYSWEKVPGWSKDLGVQAVLMDSAWSGGFWVATGVGLVRTDDNGESFYSAGRQPMGGVRGLARAMMPDENNHMTERLLAWGNDGVWESQDGGVRWSPAIKLLTEPSITALVFLETPLIATPVGLWQMVQRTEEAKNQARPDTTLSLGATVGIAWRRQGLDTAPLSLARKQAAALLAPSLIATVKVGGGALRASDYWDDQTEEGAGYDWAAALALCWGGCGAGTELTSDGSSEYYEVDGELFSSDGSPVDPGELGDTLFVVDGQIFTQDQVVAAAANVSQSVQRYQNQIYSAVAEAWLTRQRLIVERPNMSTLSLSAQVEHELKIQELTARLDIYTDGAFQRSATDPSNSSEEP